VKRRTIKIAALPAALALSATLAACGGDSDDSSTGSSGEGGENLSGTINIDGSSTVAPLAEAASELFSQEHPDVRIPVGTSGTGGGFEQFCQGETDISDASRPISEEEVAICEENGIEYDEVGIANDGLVVAINPDNDWVDCLTIDELSTIWNRGSKVDNWSQVRDGFPDEPLELYGPGSDSGTFDYFTEAVNGEEGVIRTDYNNIGEDDNAAVTGVSGSVGATGYIPLSFVEEAGGAVVPAPIENEEGECVEPGLETVQDGSYNPLGRQLFMYPSAESLERPEVVEFLNFIIENNEEITTAATYIPLNEDQLAEAQEKVETLAGN
jgi:phosphate transport system substrate-binding protein